MLRFVASILLHHHGLVPILLVLWSVMIVLFLLSLMLSSDLLRRVKKRLPKVVEKMAKKCE